jgi:hypothetical protein
MTVIREIVWKHFPLATGFIKIEDRIGNLANIGRPRLAWASALGEEWLQSIPTLYHSDQLGRTFARFACSCDAPFDAINRLSHEQQIPYHTVHDF